MQAKDEFVIRYQDNSSFFGDYMTDKLSFGNFSSPNWTFAQVDRSDLHGYAYPGVLGLGPSDGQMGASTIGSNRYPSILEAMKAQGHISRLGYGVQMPQHKSDSGSLLFGGVDVEKFVAPLQGVALVDSRMIRAELSQIQATRPNTSPSKREERASLMSKPFNVLLDCGTTYSLLPKEVLDAIIATYDGKEEDGKYYISSDAATDSNVLRFTLGDASIGVPLADLVDTNQGTSSVGAQLAAILPRWDDEQTWSDSDSKAEESPSVSDDWSDAPSKDDPSNVHDWQDSPTPVDDVSSVKEFWQDTSIEDDSSKKQDWQDAAVDDDSTNDQDWSVGTMDDKSFEKQDWQDTSTEDGSSKDQEWSDASTEGKSSEKKEWQDAVTKDDSSEKQDWQDSTIVAEELSEKHDWQDLPVEDDSSQESSWKDVSDMPMDLPSLDDGWRKSEHNKKTSENGLEEEEGDKENWSDAKLEAEPEWTDVPSDVYQEDKTAATDDKNGVGYDWSDVKSDEDMIEKPIDSDAQEWADTYPEESSDYKGESTDVKVDAGSSWTDNSYADEADALEEELDSDKSWTDAYSQDTSKTTEVKESIEPDWTDAYTEEEPETGKSWTDNEGKSTEVKDAQPEWTDTYADKADAEKKGSDFSKWTDAYSNESSSKTNPKVGKDMSSRDEFGAEESWMDVYSGEYSPEYKAEEPETDASYPPEIDESWTDAPVEKEHAEDNSEAQHWSDTSSYDEKPASPVWSDADSGYHSSEEKDNKHDLSDDHDEDWSNDAGPSSHADEYTPKKESSYSAEGYSPKEHSSPSDQ